MADTEVLNGWGEPFISNNKNENVIDLFLKIAVLIQFFGKRGGSPIFPPNPPLPMIYILSYI